MAKKEKNVLVESVKNVVFEREYKNPGTVWECPADMVDGLIATGAVKFARPASDKTNKDEGKTPLEKMSEGAESDKDPEKDE